MRFAFIFICPGLSGIERTVVRDGDSSFIGVHDIDEACSEAVRLESEGVGCIELCGAFGEDGARRVMDAVGMRIPVGYIVHLPEMDEAYARAFPSERGRNFGIHRARCPDHVR